MTNVSSVGFPEAPAAVAVEAPGKAPEAGVLPFDSFLFGTGPEAAEIPLLPVENDIPTDGEEEGAGEDVSSEVGEDDGEAPAEVKADEFVLSSCLAVWQILPPAPPVPLVTPGVVTGIDAADQKTSANESESSSAQGATPDLPTPSCRTTQEVQRFAAPVVSPVASPESVPAAPAPKPAPPAAEAPQTEVALSLEVIPLSGEASSFEVTPSTESALSSEAAPPLESAPSAGVVPAPGPAALAEAVSSPEATPAADLPRPTQPAIKGAGKQPGRRSEVAAPASDKPRTTVDGIPVAKEQRAMSDPTFHLKAKPAPAAFAERETLPKLTREVGHEAAGKVQASEQSEPHDPKGGMSDGHREGAPAEAFAAPAGTPAPEEVESFPIETKSPASEAAQAIQQIERAVDRMRLQGGQRMEMRLPMQDGAEVVVRLRIERGEVKATFHTGSEGLRQALETGWSQYSQTSSERAGKAAPAVFESPSLQSGMGGSHQSPDHRDRRGRDQYSSADFAPVPSPQEIKKALQPRRPKASAAPAASLEIYA